MESQTFTTCISVNPASNREPHRTAHDAISSGYSSTATSRWQSWDGRTPNLSPPVALAVRVCDRESLRNGCLLHVLWLDILYLQIISNRVSCLDIEALPRRFMSSNNCFGGCEVQRHCIRSNTGYLTVCCICAD